MNCKVLQGCRTYEQPYANEKKMEDLHMLNNMPNFRLPIFRKDYNIIINFLFLDNEIINKKYNVDNIFILRKKKKLLRTS